MMKSLKEKLLRSLLSDPEMGNFLCENYSSHVWTIHHVYRDPGGYTSGWKICVRCGNMLDENLDDVALKYHKIGEGIFRLKDTL